MDISRVLTQEEIETIVKQVTPHVTFVPYEEMTELVAGTHYSTGVRTPRTFYCIREIDVIDWLAEHRVDSETHVEIDLNSKDHGGNYVMNFFRLSPVLPVEARATIDGAFAYFHKRSPKATIIFLNQGQLPDTYQALEKKKQAIAEADPALTNAIQQHAPDVIVRQLDVESPPPAIMVNVFGDVSQAALDHKIETLVTNAQFETARVISFDLSVCDSNGEAPSLIQMRLYIEK